MHLSKRLEACLHYTEGFVKLADIGTDHALLPIEAVLRGNVLTALAIDNKFGPYIQARTNIIKYDVVSRVKPVLGDGLEKITDDVDVVVISGMGGELIAQILQDSPHKNVKRFILQPNKNTPTLRKSVIELGYSIMDELVLEDQNKTYEILVIEPGIMTLSELETMFGPINLKTKPYYFMKSINQQWDYLKSLLDQVQDKNKREEILYKLRLLEEVRHEN